MEHRLYKGNKKAVRKAIVRAVTISCLTGIAVWIIIFLISPEMPRVYLVYNFIALFFIIAIVKGMKQLVNYELCIREDGIFHVNGFASPHVFLKWHEIEKLHCGVTNQLMLKSFGGQRLLIVNVFDDSRLVYKDVYDEVLAHNSKVTVSKATKWWLKRMNVI